MCKGYYLFVFLTVGFITAAVSVVYNGNNCTEKQKELEKKHNLSDRVLYEGTRICIEV